MKIFSSFLFFSISQNYFRDSWNVFDFVTVVGSIVDATRMVKNHYWTSEFSQKKTFLVKALPKIAKHENIYYLVWKILQNVPHLIHQAFFGHSLKNSRWKKLKLKLKKLKTWKFFAQNSKYRQIFQKFAKILN